jgi:hypothetical protein
MSGIDPTKPVYQGTPTNNNPYRQPIYKSRDMQKPEREPHVDVVEDSVILSPEAQEYIKSLNDGDEQKDKGRSR